MSLTRRRRPTCYTNQWWTNEISFFIGCYHGILNWSVTSHTSTYSARFGNTTKIAHLFASVKRSTRFQSRPTLLAAYFMKPPVGKRTSILKENHRHGSDSWQGTSPWWRHHMETFSALPALCEVNQPVTGGFPSQRPVTRNFAIFFDLRPIRRLIKQSRRRWSETLSRPLWRHCNAVTNIS